MSEDVRPVTVAGLGDLHVDGLEEHPYRDMFAEISRQAEVLALCGDLTNLGTAEEAHILAEELRFCSIPVVAVLGNHDFESRQEREVMHILEGAGVRFLEKHSQILHGIGFAGVKGFAGGFDNRMLGAFGEEAIKKFVEASIHEALALENALHQLETERVVVVLHYAPIAETVEGEPREIFPFLGSSRLAETIDRFAVRVVLHGHAHHGRHHGRTG
ncbi:MAG: metallophosphoesterase, partial [Rhodospirillales bacterium]|nr:metallophosphoesterase [Rhodospirillales bacterium]